MHYYLRLEGFEDHINYTRGGHGDVDQNQHVLILSEFQKRTTFS